MKTTLSVMLILAAVSLLFAQSYVREGSIGTHAAQDTISQRGDDGVPFDQWVGMQFIILPKPHGQERYGYSSLRSPNDGFIIPTYDECAGQVGTVVEVDNDGHTDRKVVLQLEDGREYTAVSATGVFGEIAPVADIERARDDWQGKLIWLFSEPVYEYNADTGQLFSFDATSLEPVTVTDVVASWDNNRPARLIVKTLDGYEGFIDLQVSSTNVLEELRGHNRSGAFFVTKNPRVS